VFEQIREKDPVIQDISTKASLFRFDLLWGAGAEIQYRLQLTSDLFFMLRALLPVMMGQEAGSISVGFYPRFSVGIIVEL